MKKTWIALAVALAITSPVAAGAPRILNGTVPAAELDTIHLDAGVGDVAITAVDDATEVTIEVQLKPRRGGFFSSLKTAQREVDEAELRMDVSKRALRLEIETESNDRHFEEKWILTIPSRLDFNLDLGVGDVDLKGLSGKFIADLGVGEIAAEEVSGDLNIDIGVGEASVRAFAADYGSVSGSGGVGDARLTVHGAKVSSSGFVGHSADWSGDGDHYIEISVGVGDAKVTLE